MRIVCLIVIMVGLCSSCSLKEETADWLQGDWILLSPYASVGDGYVNAITVRGSLVRMVPEFGWRSYILNEDTLRIFFDETYLDFIIRPSTIDSLVVSILEPASYTIPSFRADTLRFYRAGRHASTRHVLERIEFSTGGCLGRCPVIDIALDNKGLLEYCGYRHVGRVGRFRSEDQNVLFNRISQVMDYSPIDALLDAGSAIDDNTMALIIWYDGKQRTFEGTHTEMRGLYLIVEELLEAVKYVDMHQVIEPCDSESRKRLRLAISE